MAKNDFDIDFDFEKEYGFDPKDMLGNDELIDDMDFSDDELGLSPKEKKNHSDFELDDELNMDDFLNMAEASDEDDDQAYYGQDAGEEEIDVPDFFDDDEEEQVTYPQEEYYEEPVIQEQEYQAEDEEPEFMEDAFGNKERSTIEIFIAKAVA